MLKYRLIFGALMIALFVGIILVDGWLDGTISSEQTDASIQATLLAILIAALAIPAQFEMAALTRRAGAVIFKPLAVIGAILLATSWYWGQFFSQVPNFRLFYMLFVSAFCLLSLFVYQYLRYGTSGTIVNCGANLFAIFYLGLLSGFVLGIRVDFGVWPLLMFICVVKSSDTGAYAAGKCFGKHKFSPKLSPGKTWEGIIGAVLAAVAVALVFAGCCGIMTWPWAVVFGGFLAFAGQLGDLAESMLKRDAEQKDSAESVPGFGGILDIIDSPLATAPLAYLFIMFTSS